jgi:hypothetical protein
VLSGLTQKPAKYFVLLTKERHPDEGRTLLELRTAADANAPMLRRQSRKSAATTSFY